jgi:endonuclease YncB( thermonuclease family)
LRESSSPLPRGSWCCPRSPRPVSSPSSGLLRGDTIKIKNTFGEMTIRLVGIDAPDLSHKKREPGQPFSQEVKKYLRALVLNKAITIREYGKDRYGRTLKSVDFALFTFRAVLKMKNTISRFQPIYSYNMNGPLSVKLQNRACSV